MKAFITIFFFLSGILMVGCKKQLLETVPNDRISTELFWKTEKDATLAANAIYPYLGNANDFFSWDGMTDIAHTNVPQSPESFILKGQYDALNSRISNEWTNSYAGIRAANAYLENVDQVETANKALIDRLKGEVRVMRAYLYIKLASLFGDVPLVKTVLSLQESKDVTRTPVNQIWDFVSAELTEASALLPNTQTDKGRITKGAALGLKARALLYAARYADAAVAAKQVMDLNVYSIYSSYKNLFTYAAENNAEVIINLEYVKDIYSNNVFFTMGPFSQKNSQGRYVPTKNLIDSYQMKNGKEITEAGSGFDPYNPYANRDPRLGYSIFVLGDVLPDNKVYNSRPGSGTADAVGFSFQATNTGFNLEKYINKEDLALPANGGINLILMRYAEILLTYAEAKIEAGQIDQSVADAINQVRSRADVAMPNISIGSQADMRKIVRKERLVELAFEGLRLVDIRRWKIAEQVMPGNVFGMTYADATNTLKTIQVQSWTNTFDKNRDYLWPVPQKERELNPNLTQNAGW